eukprot:7440622-Lingulodinium_polyedra.AAC.1
MPSPIQELGLRETSLELLLPRWGLGSRKHTMPPPRRSRRGTDAAPPKGILGRYTPPPGPRHANSTPR